MNSNDIIWQESELKNIVNFTTDEKISVDDINSFLRILIRNASVRTSISQEEIKERNSNFFIYLEKVFNTTKQISIYSKEFETLFSMFEIPVIKNNIRSDSIMAIGEVRERHEEEVFENNKTAEDCLDLFNILSNEEKIKFVLAFETVKINLSPSEILKLLSQN